ncbi:MAG TPA: protein kinase [Gemmataceae bacterium]|nr:protein kinase [Gemmataceae bacterium]
MDRRLRLAELLVAWQEQADRGLPVTAEELCRDCPELLPDLQRLMRLEEAARADDRTALSDQSDTSATDLAAAAPVAPGELGGWLAPPDRPDDLGRLGRYRIVRVIRAGGMGIVLEGEDTTLKRRVAIKVMHPRLAADPTARARFLREAEAMARLDHEHVVPVFEAAEDPTAKIAYLVMPFLQGEALSDRLKREGRLRPAEAIRIGREVAEGLQAAHDHGLIHRDVKPSNIWLDPRGKVKLLDFGLVRAGGEGDMSLSQSGQVVGTPAYMAPEQARGEPVDHRADLFALGCVLYRAATGAVPFAGSSSVATLYSVATATPADPAALNPRLTAGLVDLIQRLLAKEPEGRPASAATVAGELAELERTDSDTSVPLGIPVPDDPRTAISAPASAEAIEPAPARRTRWRSAAAIAAAAILVVAGVAATLYVTRATRGTVVVEPADPAAEVRLQTARFRFTSDDGQTHLLESPERSRELPAGTYQVTILGADGLTADPAQVEVRRGETAAVRINVTPVVHPMPPSSDPERKAAEWAHGLGGTLELSLSDGKTREVGPKDVLPPELFTVRAVRLMKSRTAARELSRLAGLKDLKILELTDCRIGDPELAGIGLISTLTHLVVRADTDPDSARVTDAGLAHLRNLTGLKVVSFPGSRITGTGLSHLQRSVGLEEIHGIGAPTDAGMAALAHFPGLKHMDLGDGHNVTDAGIKLLSGLPHLEKVIVHNSRLTDDGLKALTGLNQLRGLGADGTALTDAGLVHLKAFPALESLGAGVSGVTDTGLKTLAELQTLKWLNLRGATVTADGIQALHRALPECRIESDHGTFEPQ